MKTFFICSGCQLPHSVSRRVTLSGEEYCTQCVTHIVDDMAQELGDQEIADQEAARFTALLLAAGVTSEEAAALDRCVRVN